MHAPHAATRYTNVAIFLHWLIALLIIGNIAGAFIAESFFESSDQADKAMGSFVMGLHKATGITIIFLTLARLAWRLMHPPAPLPAHMRGWEVALSKTTHALFYVLMVGVPLAGWLMSSAHPGNFPLTWFGLFDLPQLPIADNKDVAHQWEEVHELSAFLMMGLIGLHVLAALKHQFIHRDEVLGRMIPWIKRG